MIVEMLRGFVWFLWFDSCYEVSFISKAELASAINSEASDCTSRGRVFESRPKSSLNNFYGTSLPSADFCGDTITKLVNHYASRNITYTCILEQHRKTEERFVIGDILKHTIISASCSCFTALLAIFDCDTRCRACLYYLFDLFTIVIYLFYLYNI